MSDQEAESALMLSGNVRRWLETDDTFWEQEEYGVLRGLALPEDVLEKIYRSNFERLAGDMPRPIDVEKARAECERIVQATSAVGAGGTVPEGVAEQARSDGESARRALEILGQSPHGLV